jgi:hypothetical protein
VDLQNGKTIRIPLIWYNNAQAVSKSVGIGRQQGPR